MDVDEKTVGMISLAPTPSKPHYEEVLRVCEALAAEYGSATNALANLAMQSPRYKKTLAELNKP